MSGLESLHKRYANAKGNWELWRSIYEEAYAYAFPQKDPWVENLVEGTRKNVEVFDITACNSARRLVSRLHKNLMPADLEWFELEAGDSVIDENEKKILNLQLQKFTDIIFQALNDSNFNLVINELLQDLIIGTGAMMILEGDDEKPLRFKAVAPNIIYPEADAFDEIESVWRDFNKVQGRDIERIWPKARISQMIRQQMQSNDCAEFDFIEGFVYLPDKKKYRHVVLLQGEQDCIVDTEVDSSPWIVARWSKASNEVGGRGVVLDAMPTIRSLNALVEDIMRNVALSTSPPWLASSDGIFNPYLFEIGPNKIIPINQSSMGNLPLQRLDVTSDIRMGNLEVNDMRQQIKDCLFDNPVRPTQAPQQTATEIMVRQQQFIEEIEPAFGRLSVELLPKIINRVINILQRKGYLPKTLKIDSRVVNIKYKSPLVRGADLQKVQNFDNYAKMLAGVAGPQLSLLSMNTELLPAWLADKLEVDETLIKSPMEIVQLMNQASQAAQAPNPAEGANPQEQQAQSAMNQQAMQGGPNG
jgi:tetrahydromethanopterin S-methyltransferase subunit F